MKESSINLRAKNILLRICNESDYVTISSIAKELGVSSKTILRELSTVEKWLEKVGYSLDKKAGAGIKVNGNLDDKKKIISFLDETKEEKIYTPKERQIIIISELLQNQEPVKLYSFTTILKVTEGTISNDLDKVEEWLKKHNVTLVRKQGLGVFVEGDENNIRKCMINLIYENTDENYLLGLIRSNISKSSVPIGNTELIARSRLLNLVDENTINKLETLVHNAEDSIGYRLADSAFIGLIVHLAIAIQRIRKNEDIKMNKQFLDELKESKEYYVAEKLAVDMSKIFNINIPQDEIGYITMHIKGSKNSDVRDKDNKETIGNFELVKLANEIINIAENETGRFLRHNDKLLIGLVNHLGPAISRLKMNLEIRNPLLEEIKIYYPELMKVAQKCIVVVEKYIDIKMPEAEIAYIAMHLGAAIGNSHMSPKRRYRSIITCSTGIGTSRLLATRVENEFDNIDIVDVVSMLLIEEKWLQEKGIELIISTVNIEECPVPVVTVNPLLLEEDKLAIAQLIDSLKGTAAGHYKKRKKALTLKERIVAINNYGEAIIEIEDNFFFNTNSKAENIIEIIEEQSKLITKNKNDEEKLNLAIKAREEKGGTFITGHGMVLLHCRTDAIDKLHFGIVRINKDINYKNARGKNEKLELGIILLAPEECNKQSLETISYISRMLVERAGFNKLIRTGTKEEIFSELSNILEEFYKIKCNEYMEE